MGAGGLARCMVRPRCELCGMLCGCAALKSSRASSRQGQCTGISGAQGRGHYSGMDTPQHRPLRGFLHAEPGARLHNRWRTLDYA